MNESYSTYRKGINLLLIVNCEHVKALLSNEGVRRNEIFQIIHLSIAATVKLHETYFTAFQRH